MLAISAFSESPVRSDWTGAVMVNERGPSGAEIAERTP